MNGMAPRTGVYQPADLTLEEILAELYKYAFPDLRCNEYNGLFWAQATMRIKVQGSEFKVRSEMKHASPKAAAAELLERVKSAVAQLGGMPK